MNIQHRGITNKDASRKLGIWVKPVDIKHAICRDRQKCAIAQAIKRQCQADWVDVGTCMVLIRKGKKATRYMLDNIGKQQVKFFDENKGAFAPCKVKLNPPPESMALGHRKGAKRRSGPSGKTVKHRKPTR